MAALVLCTWWGIFDSHWTWTIHLDQGQEWLFGGYLGQSVVLLACVALALLAGLVIAVSMSLLIPCLAIAATLGILYWGLSLLWLPLVLILAVLLMAGLTERQNGC